MTTKKIINSELAAPAIGPYSQAVMAGNILFASGQIPLDTHGEIVGDDVQTQAKQCLVNVKAILTAANMDLSNVIKCTIFLKDMNDFPLVNEIYADHFQAPYPARSTIEVARLPKDVRVEIEVIASI